MRRLKWLVKQLVPRTYYSTYHRLNAGGEQREFAIWRMWLGRIYDHHRFAIID